MTMCSDHAAPAKRDRVEDACQDISMAVASLLVAVQGAQTLEDIVAMRRRMQDMIGALEAAEGAAMRKMESL